MNEKATIFDYARVCKAHPGCEKCPIHGMSLCETCTKDISDIIDEANKKILDWCKAHPVKTRQSEFLKHYPNARMSDGIIDICPQNFDTTFICTDEMVCNDCRKGYWAKEVKENV